MTQAVQQGISKAIGEGDVSKQMLKNLERFDGKDKSKCLEWLSNLEIIAQHSKKSFRELVCQSMSPTLLHIFSSVSAFASDQGIKDILLANYSDVPSTAEAVAKLQGMQMPPDEPLATFNSRYQQIHQVAFQPRNNSFQNQGNSLNENRTDRFDQRRRPTKFNHSRTTPNAQVIFEYMDQNPWDVIHTVRNFISYMKGNPAQRQFFKSNKLVPHRLNTEVNESEI